MTDERKNMPKSARAFTEAENFLPGGVNSPVRAFSGAGLSPLFIERASGSKIYDIDGNEYIDYVPTLAETALAKKIIAAFDSIEKIRLVNSGTEAVMTAIRLVRGYTKKDLIIKMAGCYHGHSDSVLAPPLRGAGLVDAGVPVEIANLTIVIPYNDVDAAKTAFRMHKTRIAAVLVEPVAANMGVVPTIDGYLQTLRDLCDAENALLIFDEVITGFRLAPGGAQELLGVKADITCLGKIIGGGLPLAALGARADIMDMLAPAGESSSALLEAGLADAAKGANIPLAINRIGSLMSCFFTERKVRNFADVRSTNIKQYKRFFAEMLKQGIYLAPSAYEAMFVSLAHSKQDIEKTIKAARTSFRKIKAEG